MYSYFVACWTMKRLKLDLLFAIQYWMYSYFVACWTMKRLKLDVTVATLLFAIPYWMYSHFVACWTMKRLKLDAKGFLESSTHFKSSPRIDLCAMDIIFFMFLICAPDNGYRLQQNCEHYWMYSYFVACWTMKRLKLDATVTIRDTVLDVFLLCCLLDNEAFETRCHSILQLLFAIPYWMYSHFVACWTMKRLKLDAKGFLESSTHFKNSPRIDLCAMDIIFFMFLICAPAAVAPSLGKALKLVALHYRQCSGYRLQQNCEQFQHFSQRWRHRPVNSFYSVTFDDSK
ncbi:unnamed protein product [Xylocopa violacea]|uniref:Uncharacterized protein n=1 Tax=Xylocopa violacea TaxID=135666 RepID=A0ABP1N8A0_XYLVO